MVGGAGRSANASALTAFNTSSAAKPFSVDRADAGDVAAKAEAEAELPLRAVVAGEIPNTADNAADISEEVGVCGTGFDLGLILLFPFLASFPPATAAEVAAAGG